MDNKLTIKRFVFLALLIFSLMPSTYGILVSSSINGVGYSDNLAATNDQFMMDRAILGENGLSHTITGTTNLAESHWVANKGGAYAEVGVDIKGATKPYTYSYALDPGEGGGKTTSYVEASEGLDVPYAAQVDDLLEHVMERDMFH